MNERFPLQEGGRSCGPSSERTPRYRGGGKAKKRQEIIEHIFDERMIPSERGMEVWGASK